MSIRLIATDLDGTLLGADKEISPRNARALQECMARGVHVMLASGRSLNAVARIAERAGLTDALVLSSNGARLDETARGPILLEDGIERNIAREAAERLISAGVYVECYSDDVIYMANRAPVKRHNHRPGRTADGATLFVEDAARFLDEGTAHARKLIVFSDDPGQLERARALMRDLPLDCSSSDTDNLEILAAGAGKGRALTWYAERMNIARDEIMAFGDQTNDLSLMDAAGWPVAMDNAVDVVKARARLVAPHHDRSGVAAIVEKYVLEGGLK